MLFCGLDQALKISGYAIFDNEILKSWGTLETNPTHSIEQRLHTIWKHLDMLHNEYPFNYMFFEDTQKQINQDTYKRLCYVQAVVMLWCFWNHIEFTVLSPSHWRKVIRDKYGINFGRKREEQKAAAVQWVKNNYNLGMSKITEDECDAVCICAAGMLEYNKNRSAF